MSKAKIGYIGVGLMGHGAAKNILAKGYPLTIMGHRNRAPVDDLVKRGAGAVDGGLNLDRGGETQEQDVARPRDLGRALSLAGATLHQVVDRCTVAMAHDGERMALLQNVLRGAVAHQSDADVADL